VIDIEQADIGVVEGRERKHIAQQVLGEHRAARTDKRNHRTRHVPQPFQLRLREFIVKEA
jgi:hypothetical protein